MKDFLVDSNTVCEKGMQGYTALTIIEENLNRLDELLKEASNEINRHDELNRIYYQSLESDIQYLRDYKNKYQSFIVGTYNVNGDGGFVGEYKDTVDDPYYKQKEELLDKLGDLKLENIRVENKLGISTNAQAFVGHTTMLKDTVNIRDILGFGNISDNIKKQYEESKALIEKYNEGLNTYNEADYPSILPSFAKKLWYNLTKKKEKTIDNYDDYLDAIIKSGDFNFETEGEKKLSIGLDFIPILGIEKMTLEGLLGEDLVSGKDLNGLERILAVVPVGVGALSKVKNAIKLGEVGVKVEGSISFGMNGGGQLEDILSKLKKSKAEEDMVAKEAVNINNGVSNPKNLAKVSLDTRKMSVIERTNYILEHTDLTREQVQDYLDINYYRNPEIGDAFRNEGIIKSGNNVLIPRSTKYLDEDGFINWELAPEKGYVLDDKGNAIKDILTSKPSGNNRMFDRYGNEYGNYLSPVDSEGNSYAFEKRALPYVGDKTTHHVYEETGDLSNIRNDIINSSLSDSRKQELLNKLGDNKTYIGEAKGAYGPIGGAEQVETPLSIKELCEIGTLTER